MIAVDTQVLIYAHRRDAAWHARASACLEDLAAGPARWAIPFHCLVELYAHVTNRKLYKGHASTPAQALDQIDAWLEAPTVAVLTEDGGTWSMLRQLLDGAAISGSGTHDARIAAVCLQHGVSELWTNDRDFLKFPALRVHNPLVHIHPTRAGEPRAAYGAHRPRRRARRSDQR